MHPFRLCFCPDYVLGLGVGLQGHMIALFLVFLRNIHTVLRSGSIRLHSHQQCRRVPSSPHPLQYLCFLLLLFFFYASHSDQCKVISHWSFDLLSLLISNVEHLFMCLLAICIFSLEKCVFRFSAHFLSGLFVLMLLSVISCL